MRIPVSAALIALLAACSSAQKNEQPPAGVEERRPVAKPAEQPAVAKVDLTQKPAMNLLTDPGSILSKRSIYYDFDKYDVQDQYKGLIEAHAKYLRDHPDTKMLIQGNTDERGSREYNVGLGQRRSDGVKGMLKLLGVKEDQVESVSLGEEKPKSEGHDEAAWAQNRRSDMLYSGEY